MRAIREIFRKPTVALALSIAAMPGLVNGQDQGLTSVNKAKSGISRLVAAVLKVGVDENTGSTLAPVIGLSKAMPTKTVEVGVSNQAEVTELRRCFVVYENEDGTDPTPGNQRPVCAYIVKVKRLGFDRQTRYFKVDLNGKLEKVILSQGKIDENGKAVRGSGIKTDQDINSPEVKKTFKAEMDFWLKDWLKKEQKAAAKKTS